MEFHEMIDSLGLNAEQVLESIVTSDMPYVFVFKDRESRILYVNQQFYIKHPEFKEHPQSVIGKTDFDLFPLFPNHAKQAYEDEQTVMKTKKPLHIFETEGQDARGYTKVAHTRKYPLLNSDKECVGVFVVTEDVTQDVSIVRENIEKNTLLMKLNQELTIENTQDALSGLYNKRFIRAQLNSLYKEYKTNNQLFSIILLDLDDFKNINDTYGHNVGDEVISYIGTVLKNIQHLLYTDVLPCRFGGDEFLLILPHHNYEEAIEIAKNVKEAFDNQKISLENFYDFIRVSVGIATIQDETIHQLIERCDRYLYNAKKNGKCQICFGKE
ncbi:MAG: diguanylate cyclase [Longibaculum sp.]